MKKNSQAFVNQLVVCLLVTMTFGGSIGLGTVWVRHQMSVTAKANRALLAAISEVNRRSDDIEAQIRSEQRPELLRQLNLEFRLGLAPITDSHLAINGGTACLTCWRYHCCTMACFRSCSEWPSSAVWR